MSIYNQDMLDTISLVSFLVGVANYSENLTQSDKEDIMKRLDEQTRDILEKVRLALEEQNVLLRKILKAVDK